MLARLPAPGPSLAALTPGLDWEALVRSAARHGVSALIADALAEAGVTPPPVPAAALADDARRLVAQGLKLKRLTHTVLGAFSARGVVPIALKGYGLALRLYPRQPLARPATDVDILVAPEQLRAVEDALRSLGLARVEDMSLADVFEEHHHLSFSGPRGLVEVHFRLFSGFGGAAFDDRALAARSWTGSIDGRPARYLAPEDELVYLATHAANHAFLRASWLVDLQRFLAHHPALDWAEMAARAERAGFRTAVATTLALLERLLEVRLPEAAQRAFPLGRGRRLVDRLAFSPASLDSSALAGHHLGSFLLRLLLVDSAGHGLRHLVDGARRYLRRARAER
ncbi:MAG: nucleotidyltransferase family protein [Deltaproteobacteria bacterium]|nr:nucleotidyltransferase family protein [Deltaproteobacteria bacterium]